MSGAEEDGGKLGVYERIFADAVRADAVRADAVFADAVRKAIARAVRELRTAMEKEDNAAVTLAHMRSLDDMDPADLARGYTRAERSCTYWPTPGEIRELAGCSDAHQAQKALEWVLDFLEEHGAEGRARGGGVRFEVDGEGRRMAIETAPAASAPELPLRIRETLAAMGDGSVKHGLYSVAQHPRIKGWEEMGSEAPGKSAERIARQWMRCYRQHG